jgi:hypothetical protein
MPNAAPHTGATYILTGPDGTKAVFNDQTDPDYVGMLNEITGLDSPDVRESADDLVQFDGGIHGAFFYGRRPIVMTGIVLNPDSVQDRNERIQKIQHASNAMRQDAILQWISVDGDWFKVGVRRQQPLRVTGAWQKQFQIALVAADPRIYSDATHLKTVALFDGDDSLSGRGYDAVYDKDYGPSIINGQALVENVGTADTYPVITVNGPIVNPVLFNFTTGQAIHITYTLEAGESLVIDLLNRTVKLNGTASRYGAVDFAETSWWALVPGINDIRFSATSFSDGATYMSIVHRDAWV